ncbi:MAG: hypothetical protein ACOC2N_04930 [Spirochaetota bacterium]
MKKSVLNRYERSPEGLILIDVTADRAEDLYSDFDRSAPYIRRDLDPDLVDYLIYDARELGREPFGIQFTLARRPDESGRDRIRRSVHNFFVYLVEIQRHKIRQLAHRSLILSSIGIAILFISVWANSRVDAESRVLATVLAEGLTVAAWVSLWEALAVFLIDWFPHTRDMSLYRRLADASLRFRAMPGSAEWNDPSK